MLAKPFFFLPGPLILGALVLTTPLLAGGLTVQMPPERDNTLYEDAGNNISNGAGQHLFAGVVEAIENNTKRRAVLAFPVDFLPPDAVVSTAVLTLNMSRSIAGQTEMTLHRMTADWGEGTSDAPMQEGGGAMAETGDATWGFAFFEIVVWATDGGDFDPSASASTGVAGNGAYSWGPSSGLTADVQSWITTPSGNFGWILLGDESSTPPTSKRFDTREHPTASQRPMLTVTFSSASTIFLDNFESGDVSAWSSSVP